MVSIFNISCITCPNVHRHGHVGEGLGMLLASLPQVTQGGTMSTQDHWTELQNQLQKEIYLMRELLSNMHQEEVSLILHDLGSRSELLDQRTQLLDKLSVLRNHKEETIQLLEITHSPLEIHSLIDQITALTEKVNRQTTTNRRLSTTPDYYPQLTKVVRPKKKTMVTTLQIKR